MYDHLGALKDDALDLAAGAVGVTVGALAAKWVTGQLEKTLEIDTFVGGKKFGTVVNGLIPIAVGALIQTYGASKLKKDTFARNATTGVAVGMVAYGLGRAVGGFLDATQKTAYLPFNGLGETDVYDYGMGGLGIGPGDVTAYMNGAPFTSESLMGAPVDIQLAGAPVSISSEPSMSAMASF